MIEIVIPGGATLSIHHLVLDYNGTVALDGQLIEGVVERLKLLAQCVQLHVLTADTHGTVRQKVAGVPCLLHVIAEVAQDNQKSEYINALGANTVVAIGNGRNDAIMLAKAALGIAVLQNEGMSALLMTASDVICKDIKDALDLLLIPTRLKATLRN
ncbi:MAG: ATPase P [Desulfotalea sp.]|nr:MAG: ATPase P [Desulfotalea sp.]